MKLKNLLPIALVCSLPLVCGCGRDEPETDDAIQPGVEVGATPITTQPAPGMATDTALEQDDMAPTPTPANSQAQDGSPEVAVETTQPVTQ